MGTGKSKPLTAVSMQIPASFTTGGDANTVNHHAIEIMALVIPQIG